jgi:hypothetical protein
MRLIYFFKGDMEPAIESYSLVQALHARFMVTKVKF